MVGRLFEMLLLCMFVSTAWSKTIKTVTGRVTYVAGFGAQVAAVQV